MKIVFICTNYGSHKDGIGHYTYHLAQEIKKQNIEVDFISGNTECLKGISKLKSKLMINEIDKFIRNKVENINKDTYFIIEYPFLEWNPLVLMKILKLRKICKKNGSKIIISIHEYKRVAKLRKKFTEILTALSDAIMVTDKETYNIFKRYNKPILMRNIPSNIPLEEEINKKGNTFCYFGLVNKSKSFKEMIEAWKIFNSECKYRLHIYTSSEIEIKNMDEYNIYYYKDLNDAQLSKELWKCKYSILPINPSIGQNNATLKAVAQHKCIPIGIFASDELLNLGVGIDDVNYSVDNIKQALHEAVLLTEDEVKTKQNIIKKFGDRYSFKNNSDDMIGFINHIIQ